MYNKIQDEIKAAKWEKVARWLAQYLSDWLGECPSGADVTPLPDCEKVCDSISVPECWIIAAARAVVEYEQELLQEESCNSTQ